MKGENQELEDLFRHHRAYVIPQYQRAYAWREPLWQALIQDVMETFTRPSEQSHWLGVLLYSNENPPDLPGLAPLDDEVRTVIDGQQRLVTLAMWLAALNHAATDAGRDPIYSMDRIRIYVQASDQRSFDTALQGSWRAPKHFSAWGEGPLAAYIYFRWLLWLGEAALLADEPIPAPRPPADQISIEEHWAAYLASRRGEARLEKAGLQSFKRVPVSPAELIQATTRRGVDPGSLTPRLFRASARARSGDGKDTTAVPG